MDEQKVTQWTRERLIGGHKDGGVSAVSKRERYQRALAISGLETIRYDHRRDALDMQHVQRHYLTGATSEAEGSPGQGL